MPRKYIKLADRTPEQRVAHAEAKASVALEEVPNAALWPSETPWGEPQRMHVYLALIECSNEIKVAREILKKNALMDPTVRVPTKHQLFSMRRKNMQEYMETISDQRSLTRLMELIGSGKEEVALGAIKYQMDRTHGQPTKKIEMEVTVSLSALEARLRSEGAIPDLPALPPEQWSDGDGEEKTVANPTKTLDRTEKV